MITNKPDIAGNPEKSHAKLGKVKGGRTIEITEINGLCSLYMVVWVQEKQTPLITALPDQTLIVNLKTGRLVYKPNTVSVRIIRAKLELEYVNTVNTTKPQQNKKVNYNV